MKRIPSGSPSAIGMSTISLAMRTAIQSTIGLKILLGRSNVVEMTLAAILAARFRALGVAGLWERKALTALINRFTAALQRRSGACSAMYWAIIRLPLTTFSH